MEKVITIHAEIKSGTSNNFTETEHPLLKKYLEEGFTVKTVYPVIPETGTRCYSLTFILSKFER